ncbi:hypothetical protein [Streptomyces sp. bgisy100]|uniref:hypothetical protein n=1 Tax=Streptomyces sp. bgisy100 TaxID=3413783 RepID=UPI003D708841
MSQISFHELLEIQLEAEEQGWATRWTSVDELRSQVKEEPVLLQSLMREEQDETVRTYRCLLLLSSLDGGSTGGVATIDLAPARFASLKRLDRDPDIRKAFARIFSLALSGISTLSKK